MNTKAIVAVVVLACVVLVPVVIAAEGVVGEWEFKSQMPARTSTATMTITKNADGKLAGTWSAQFGESTLSDITFEAGKVKFVQTSNFGGQEMKTTYEGTLEGGKLKGTGKGQFGEFTFEGTLQGEAKTGADAIVGGWQMSVNMPARDNVEKLTVTKNADGTLAGKWEGRRGESKISNMKFEGGKLTFIRASDFGGRIMESEFEGTVEGDSIKGVFKSDRGNRDANATRIGASKSEPNKPASPAKRGEPAPKKPDAPKPK
ncbi:MAG: hypothetical protein ABSA64_10800 [Sedimentisphaerales bacterium]|jgi:hypothetical protein